MRPVSHIIVSFSIGAAVGLFTRSLYAGLACFASGTFSDIDHVMEYIIHHGWRGLSIKNIYLACEQTSKQEGDLRFRRLYLIFHAGEIAVLSWILLLYTKNIYILAIALGYSTHIIMDSVRNPMYPYSYFMTWRIINNFDASRLFRKR